MRRGLPHDQRRQSKSENDKRHTQVERQGAEPVAARNPAGRECGRCHGEIAREFVDAHGESTPLAPDEINFHDDRR